MLQRNKKNDTLKIVKNYFYILLIEVSFGAIVIEPESQIQNSIYYNSLDEDFYYKIGDTNTHFAKIVLNLGNHINTFFSLINGRVIL